MSRSSWQNIADSFRIHELPIMLQIVPEVITPAFRATTATQKLAPSTPKWPRRYFHGGCTYAPIISRQTLVLSRI